MRKRMFLIYIVYILLIVFMSYGFIYTQRIRAIKEEYVDQLSRITTIASRLVCTNALYNVINQEISESTKEYQNIFQDMLFIKNLYSDIVTYIYIYVPYEANIVSIIIDADEDISYFGTLYDAALFPEMLLALDTDRITTEEKISYDKEFDIYTLSSFGPLYDKQGKQIATLGIDSSADNYFYKLKKEAIIIAMLCFIIVLFFSVLPWIILYLKENLRINKTFALSRKIIKERKKSFKRIYKE